MVNSENIIIGAPDQLVTGAALVAPVGTPLPDLESVTKASVTIDNAFKDTGYISEDGLTIGFGMSTSYIKDWGLNKVRNYLEEFDGTVAFGFLESNSGSLEVICGPDYVEEVAATPTDGKKTLAKFGARMAPSRAWVFKIKDGDARMLVCLPNAQVTNIEDITIAASSAVTWGITLSCSADADGNSIYVLIDDGVVSA